ncbi:hypothetical protein [Marinobacterium aestuariivivens]|uniref:Uncharacterized protein n=1 Tax=Marinobacterium aestuariivivens TaxID=1698799 RepID=A0ABW2A4N6_9GAMM
MTGICSHCKRLIDSAFETRPHDALVYKGQGAEGDLYRCSLCGSCFEFTTEHIYLLGVDAVLPESLLPPARRA